MLERISMIGIMKLMPFTKIDRVNQLWDKFFNERIKIIKREEVKSNNK